MFLEMYSFDENVIKLAEEFYHHKSYSYLNTKNLCEMTPHYQLK